MAFKPRLVDGVEFDARKGRKYTPINMGMSMAATWSWGASVLVGIAIIGKWGLGPYLIWMFGNILAIPFFGFIYTRLPNVKKWRNLVPFVACWAFVQTMAIIMNLSFLQGTLSGKQDIPTAFVINPIVTSIILYAVAGGLLLYVTKERLWGSYVTDLVQYRFQLICAVLLAAASVSTGFREMVLFKPGSEKWSVFAFLGIITGVTAGGQEWQRLERMKGEEMKTALWGGFFFGIYMIPCALIALSFSGSLIETLLLFSVVLFVTSSTIDSGYAGMQFIGERLRIDRRIPTAISIIALLIFPVVQKWGVVQIWSFYAGIRWKIIIGLIICTIFYNCRRFIFVDYWIAKFTGRPWNADTQKETL